MNLHDRVALVTGASSGIGLSVARMLVARGARVALVARGQSRLAEVSAELGDRALALPCDVGDLAQLVTLPKLVLERFGRLDIIVNNAGVHHRGDMMRHPPSALAQMFMVNLIAPVVLTRVAAEEMPRGSVVVNVGSLAGKLGLPGSAVYSGTKAGLRFWSLAVAEDLGKLGIRVACVNPGPVDTGFFDEDMANVSALTFSQPMVSADAVAECVLRAIHSIESPLEIDIPTLSGKLATMSYLSPRLRRALRPLLERKGQAAKERYMKRRGVG